MPTAARAPGTITLAGREVAYTIRRSARAESVRLRVTARTGLEIVVPQRTRLPNVPALLHRHAAWILRTLDRYPSPAPEDVRRPAPADGDRLPYRGAGYRLAVRVVPGRRPTVTLDERAGILTVWVPARDDFVSTLEGWCRARAREVLEARVAAIAPLLGVAYGRVAVRDQRTRWGSCSSGGNLNFNWRLVLAPPAILDYVVIHELAHRRELNHSPRFWALVAAHCPDHRIRQGWLKEHGPALMALCR